MSIELKDVLLEYRVPLMLLLLLIGQVLYEVAKYILIRTGSGGEKEATKKTFNINFVLIHVALCIATMTTHCYVVFKEYF